MKAAIKLFLISFLAFFSINAFALPVFDVLTASIYQSSSTIIGSGTPICTGLEIDDTPTNDPDSCTQQLVRGNTYRFEFVAGNTGDQIGSPSIGQFKNTYASGSVLGNTIAPTSCGCTNGVTTRGGTISVPAPDIQCTFSFPPAVCTISVGGTATFYFIAIIGTNAGNDIDDYFRISQGANRDSSETITFNVTSCSNGIIDAGEECDDSNLIDGDGCNSYCRLPYCGNNSLDTGEQCEAATDLTSAACFSNQCNAFSCKCNLDPSGAIDSTGVKVTGAQIKSFTTPPTTTFITGDYPKEFDLNAFVLNSATGTYDIQIDFIKTGQTQAIGTLLQTGQNLAAGSNEIKVELFTGFQNAFKGLSSGSYTADIKIKQSSQSVAQKNIFFTITTPKTGVAVDETNPALAILTALLVLSIIAKKKMQKSN